MARMSITYVCLSDLHFGAPTSLLTNLCGDQRAEAERPFEVDAAHPSPVLIALVDALRERLRDQPPPRLFS
jgi:hypothetical protein